MYTMSVCLSDIPQENIKRHERNGKLYVNLFVADKKEEDQYGYNAFVAVSQTKEEREAKAPTVYCGNAKKIDSEANMKPVTEHPFAATASASAAADAAPAFTADEIPDPFK